eukprot:CAMPEP_0201871834 /NCGR_PEP_ID=MMETSP0902-20130614/4662_1 /ASSEMBLY_ACC=CAM_ASM_000551 /TAXON_ID=420261 /ORGANISM="Thalassiosira antarctica, Strain CCMP982" /LENGTH=248 /DNA_ID=CAMNT_0048397935 /DNA_START=8 /DNA_END=754 /DNA_ORIENTATION=-
MARIHNNCSRYPCLNDIWFLFLLTIIGSLTSGATAASTLGFQPTHATLPIRSTFKNEAHGRSISNGCRSRKITRHAAPEGALSDIVIPSIFNLSDWKNANNEDEEEDPRVWVPQTDCLSFRPLCFCTSQGYYVNLLKFTGGGILGRHRHSSPVHAVTFKGSWGYREHDWHAHPGTYVFEPPGETHTLVVDEDCEEMVALFHVTGSLLYVSEETGEITGFDDVFSKLEKARDWYEECGLGKEYADQFIR